MAYKKNKAEGNSYDSKGKLIGKDGGDWIFIDGLQICQTNIY
jgi:hypothetical protein